MKCKSFIIFGGILLGLTSLNGCSSTDDDEGVASTSAGVIEGVAKVRVTQAETQFGNYHFYYDDNGQIDHILNGNYKGYRFTYNPNKVIWYENESGEEDDEVSISYNSRGYVQKLEASSERKDGLSSWAGSGTSSYSYDGAGHLTKISSSWNENETEDGETILYTTNTTTTFTWQNDMLLSIALEEIEKKNGEATWTHTSTITYDYQSDNIEDYYNQYLQYAPSISKRLEGMGDGELEEALAYIGLMGKGPQYLPISSKEEWVEIGNGRTRTGSPSTTFSYGFNKDGTLSYTMVNGRRYTISYSPLQDNIQKVHSNMNPPFIKSKEERIQAIRNLFTHPRHN